MDPASIFFGLVTLGLAHFGTDTETRYEAGCWSMMAWYRCHQENFADVHTPAYMAAIKSGHDPRKRKPHGR